MKIEQKPLFVFLRKDLKRRVMSAVTDLRFESARFVGSVMRRTKNASSEFEVENNAHRKARSEPQKRESRSAFRVAK